MPIIIKLPYQATWEIRHQVMWPDQPLEFVKLPNDKEGIHYGLVLQDELVSVVSLFIDGDSAQFRKLATLAHHQGKGYGSMLLTYVFKKVEKMNIERIWCNARRDKTSFYKRFRMKKTKEKFSKGGIDYVVMERSIN